MEVAPAEGVDEGIRVVTLPPHRGRRIILGLGLWFLAIWYVLFGVAWVVDAAITGEEVWLIAPAVLILVATVWVIVKAMRLETIYVGNLEIRRVGVLKEHRIKWADVTGSHWITRPRTGNRRPVRLLMIDGASGQELLVAPKQVADPTGVLSWAIDEAAAGRPEAIDERVRREGEKPRKNKVFAVHGAIGLVVFVGMGALLFPARLERHMRHQLRVIDELPVEERITETQLRALRAAGQDDRADVVAAECRETYGEGVATTDLLAPCRE